MRNIRLRYLALIFIIGVGLGYYFSPQVIHEEEKTRVSETSQKEEYVKETKKFDRTGRIREEITEFGKKKTEKEAQSHAALTEKRVDRKQFAGKVGGVLHPRTNKIVPRVGGEVRLPIFDSWMGAEVDASISDPSLGYYLRLEF